MNRPIALVLFVLIAALSQAQVLSFDHGKVEFRTKTIMSDIEAESKDITVSLDVETGAVEIGIPITSFEFEYDMMQDHFNEEYLESHLYADASFVGKVAQDITDIQETIEVDVSGSFTIHGVTKSATFKATLSKADGFTKVRCVFPVVFKDYHVDNPSILSKSVAKDVEVKAILYLK